jgi:hypothetical protein
MIAINIHHLHEYESGGKPMGYYAKGHHEPAAFLDAVKEWSYPLPPPEGDVHHELWRVMPSGVKGEPGWFHTVREKKRGAFEVTVIEF